MARVLPVMTSKGIIPSSPKTVMRVTTEAGKGKSEAGGIRGEGVETLKVIKMSGGLGGGTVQMREIGAGGDGEVAGEMGMGGGGGLLAGAEVGM